ncbi:hypothetical protein V1524DRAFT_41933 [Lipomyces starkeyi]
MEKLMTWPTSDSIEAEWRRRNEAVEAVRVYCDVLEGGPRRGRRPKATVLVVEDTVMADVSTESAALLSARDESFRVSEEHIRTAAKPLRCFQCYGDLGQADNRRVQEYRYHKNLIRHFRTWHMDDRRCNFCGNEEGEFLLQMHWQRHAQAIHRLKT